MTVSWRHRRCLRADPCRRDGAAFVDEMFPSSAHPPVPREWCRTVVQTAVRLPQRGALPVTLTAPANTGAWLPARWRLPSQADRRLVVPVRTHEVVKLLRAMDCPERRCRYGWAASSAADEWSMATAQVALGWSRHSNQGEVHSISRGWT